MTGTARRSGKNVAMWSSIRTQALLLSAVPLATMVLLLIVAGLVLQTTRQAVDLTARSQRILDQTTAAGQEISDANRSLAQYVAKRRDADLRAYQADMRAMVAHGKTAQALVAGDPKESALAQRYVSVLERVPPLFASYANAAVNHDQGKLHVIEGASSTRRLGNDLRAAQGAFDGAERMAEVDAMTRLGARLERFAWLLVAALILGIAVMVLSVIWVGMRILNRLRHLGKNASRLERGEAAIPLEGNDEIAELDVQYRTMAQRLRQEHDVATTLQRALLPQRMPRIPGLRIDAAYLPAAADSEIGGDWYDIFGLGDSTVGISIGDVTGHGLTAASTMATTRQSIRTAARFTPDPSTVLALVNRLLCDEEETLVTAFFGVLDMKTGLLLYALAGHPAPITVHASGDVEVMEGGGLILGLNPNVSFERYETMLEEGSALVLYTDGVVETRRDDYQAGLNNLIEAINAEYYNARGNIAEAVQERIFRNVEPRDDSAVVFIGLTELGGEAAALRKTWSIDARSVEAARRVKRALLWQIGEYTVQEADLASIELIYGELVGNVARHTPGHADVTLEVRGSAAVLHVGDRGAPIGAPPAVSQDPADLSESGRGLFLVQSLARDVRIERKDGGNYISATLPITLLIAS